ncbi:hypothetical protein ZIOFF_009770 [Zingiber officinale]|uniref:J domain-containing protein n=1 Tax=Zingiber officinale TaxID=94328 RepID=A0A8J5LYN3_ZINOF|nr:hypothetical protein ZIOFF_009770 [Zingiber officinale]
MGRARLSSSRSFSSDSESSDKTEKRSKKKETSRSSRHKESSGQKKKRHSKSERRRDHEERRGKRRDRKKLEKRHKSRRKKDGSDDSDYSHFSSSYSGEDSVSQSSRPEAITRLFLQKFPNAADDLKQLLHMIDSGQGVDVGGISDKSLVKLLRHIVGPILCPYLKTGDSLHPVSKEPHTQVSSPSEHSPKDQAENDTNLNELQDEGPTPGRRRLIGPEMPSREVLAAAAELTEAESSLLKKTNNVIASSFDTFNMPREAELDIDSELLIGPPPPAIVSEAASANEAERFEEVILSLSLGLAKMFHNLISGSQQCQVARIVSADVDKPYDILGVNWKMSSENIKKRYWKLSLLVHPDKCTHPQAHQAFVLLNQAFKDLQDPDKVGLIMLQIHFPTVAAGGSGLIQLFWIGWHNSRLTWARNEEVFMCWIYWICIDDRRAFTSNGLLSSTVGQAAVEASSAKMKHESSLRNGGKVAIQWNCEHYAKLLRISMEGDDELLAMPMAPINQDEREPSKREEWMTTLPPERKPGMTMQSTSFSRTTKEGRGDTSAWTDNPLDKAQKAKQNYLEAYNKAKTLGDVEGEKERKTKDADLVDKYNASKRSVSLVQKHREETSRPKKKVKRPEKDEWEGQHPWKPWDREKDLTAGRKKVNFDADNMSQGLSSRFSSGSVQRNFL